MPSDLRHAWLVRPPKLGGFDDRALETGIITGEYGVRGDLSDHFEVDMILQEIEEAYPNDKPGRSENHAKQLHVLLNLIQPGDLILHPHDQRKSVAIGIVNGGFVTDADDRPARAVDWLRTDIPKTDLHVDLHHSMSAGAQICELSRNQALERLEIIVRDGKDPGPSLISDASTSLDEAHIIPILEDRMRRQVGSLFAGHDLAALVGCLLEVEGYKVFISPPGPDGGCDLLAAKGSLGIEGPTITGQVKSGDIKAGDPVLQGLRGVMQARGADKGLLVSWNGVTRPVARELEQLRLQIAYWDSSEICRRLIQNFDRMPNWVRDKLRMRVVPILEPSGAS